MRWNAVAQVAVAIAQLVVTIALVRLLAPADFGRIALVYFVSGLVGLLDEGGLSTLIIARDERDGQKLSLLFYQELLVGAVFAAGTAVLAPLLARLFDQPDLTVYLLVLAPVFVVTGPRRFYQSLFQRAFAFKSMGIVRIIASALFVLVTLVLAKADYGVWSLVYGLVVRLSTESLGYLFVGLREFVPEAPSVRQWRTGYGRLGIAKLGERLMAYLIERIDILIIGKALGPGALGVYDVFKRFSLGLFQQVVPLVGRIALPHLARLQAEPRVLAKAYAKQLSYVCYALFPAYAFLAFFSHSIVAWVFGEQWIAYSAVFAWISLLLLVRSIGIPIDALLMARGFVKQEFLYSAGVVTVLAATLITFVGDGLQATVVAVTWLYVMLTVPTYVWVVRPASYVRAGTYLKVISYPLLLAACTGLLGKGIAMSLERVTDGATVLGLCAAVLTFAMISQQINPALRSRIKPVA